MILQQGTRPTPEVTVAFCLQTDRAALVFKQHLATFNPPKLGKTLSLRGGERRVRYGRFLSNCELKWLQL